MNLAELRKQREQIYAVAARHGATDVRVFGSVARGNTTAESDVDFLVQLEPGRSLFDLGGLLMDLQDLLGVRVDVATVQSLKPRVRERALQDARPL